ncbi:MAG: hypothetical protein UW09_C0004G0125 [candidate division TM6 bacterium GW2011_GWF2_43_87]|nr:MAG: hypothetical protein UW09_C0004G0125 [candidate division TM6 bacterium GW2011_GWF2_43_87]
MIKKSLYLFLLLPLCLFVFSMRAMEINEKPVPGDAEPEIQEKEVVIDQEETLFQLIEAGDTQKFLEVFSEQLLKKDIDLEYFREEDHQTLLSLAASKGNITVAKALIDAGAMIDNNNKNNDLPIEGNGRLPLHESIEHGQLEMIKYLICNFSLMRDKKAAMSKRIAFLSCNIDPFNGKTPLHKAVESGSCQITQFLLDSFIESFKDKELGAHECAINFMSITDYAGESALHRAVVSGNIEMVKLLIHYFSSTLFEVVNGNVISLKNFVNAYSIRSARCIAGGLAPLHMAVKNNDLAMVKCLVESGVGVEIDAQDDWGLTPVQRAATCGYFEIVTYLLEKGADLFCPSFAMEDGKQLFFNRMKEQREKWEVELLATVKSLATAELEKCEIEQELKKGEREPLCCVPLKKRLLRREQLLKVFAQKKIELEQQIKNMSQTLLFLETQFPDEHKEKVKEAKINEEPVVVDAELVALCPDELLFTALERGVLQEVKHALEEKFANIEGCDAYACTPLLAAASKAGPAYVTIVKYLIDQGADLTAVDFYKNSALHLAALNENMGTIRVLLEAGVSCDAVNSENVSAGAMVAKAAAFDAVDSGDINRVRGVIGAQMPIDTLANKRGEKLLHCAVLTGSCDVVRFLVVERSATINVVDANGNTPMHNLACMINPAPIMNFLLQFNPDVNKKNNAGLTPLDLAVKENNLEVQQIFKGYAARRQPSSLWGKRWFKGFVVGGSIFAGMSLRWWYARRHGVSFIPKFNWFGKQRISAMPKVTGPVIAPMAV